MKIKKIKFIICFVIIAMCIGSQKTAHANMGLATRMVVIYALGEESKNKKTQQKTKSHARHGMRQNRNARQKYIVENR